MEKLIFVDDAIEALQGREAIISSAYDAIAAIKTVPTIKTSEDCISREWLEEQYWQTLIPKGMVNTYVELGTNIGIEKMHAVIKNAPSAAPKRAEGEWIYCEDDEGQDGYRCSECGFFVPWYYGYEDINYIYKYHACPSCMARMKGADDVLEGDR